MTPKNTADPEENPLGVLDDAASLDTAGIGILGRTAQVSVTLPKDEDDDLADDGVVDGEVIGDLIVDDAPMVSKAAAAPKAAAVAATVPAAPAESVSAADPAKTESSDLPSPPTEEEPIAAAPVIDEPPLFTDRIVIEAPEPISAPTEIVVEAELVDEGDAPSSDAESDGPDPSVQQDEVDVADAADEPDAVEAAEAPEPEAPEPEAPEPEAPEPEAPEPEAPEPQAVEPKAADVPEPASAAEKTAAAQFLARADADARTAARSAVAGTNRAPIEKETAAVSTPEQKKSVVPQPTRATARADVTLTSKRLDELGESSRESADLLTADRLLDPHRLSKPEPEGAWSHFLYTISGRRINIGDGRRARERKALSARIAAPLSGGARFVPVLSRKGGVGKTTITALLGMALADARDDRVIAVDANPDRGTLAERIVRPHHNKSVRDLVRIHDEVRGYHDISAIVARDATRLDVLASDADPRIAEAFSDSDYRDVAGVAAHYYSLVLTDTGTGIVHSVMSATLDLADQIVIVSGLSVDEARLASETLTWLETNGYAEQAREAIVVLNQSTPGAPLVRLNELQTHFATRAKSVIRMPYDPQIAGGGTIVFANLLPETRVAARQLAALLVEGLRAKAA